MSRVRAAVVAVAGAALSAEERALFRRRPPLGFVLFRENCRDPEQLRRLVAELKALAPRRPVPCFVDQEGGRVQRLAPPAWPPLPPAAVLGRLWERDPGRALAASTAFAEAVAAMLVDAGVDVALAPVLDLPAPGSSEVIGDRAFSSQPEAAARLAGRFARTLMRAGIAPTIKHLPGHGRAAVDSHHALPQVPSPLQELRTHDFLPFRRLRRIPFGMTAHIRYSHLDPDRPATLSPRVIRAAIRGEIGFRGILLSDDLAMGALEGPLAERTRRCLAAGCDVALLGSRDLGAREEVLEAAAPVPAPLLARIGALLAALERRRRARGGDGGLERLHRLLAAHA